MLELKGFSGCTYQVYQTATGTWAWKDSKGYGFTNESLQYILDYLVEAKGVRV